MAIILFTSFLADLTGAPDRGHDREGDQGAQGEGGRTQKAEVKLAAIVPEHF